MRVEQKIVELHRLEPGRVARVSRIEHVCVAAAGLTAFAGLLEWMIPGLSRPPLALLRMSGHGSLATLACAASLQLSYVRAFRGLATIRRLLAIVAALAGLASLVELAKGTSWVAQVWSAGPLPANPGTMPALAAVGFVLLSLVLLFLDARKGVAGYVADVVLFGLGWVVLAIVAASLFSALHVFRTSPPAEGIAVTCALGLLTFAAFSRRTVHGHFGIFLGHGVGSRFARQLSPLLLVLPFLREAMRARLIQLHHLSPHHAAAMLASATAMLAVGVVMLVAHHIRKLEVEIHDLSLRDELTGLYNLRGFQLLAEQALRLANRSQMPFSVLFVDMDNLKQINDRQGHGVGSRLLMETADFLKENFRESDVVGRIGGDEFAVAGHFTLPMIEMMEHRLEEQSESSIETRPRLDLSIGHVTADPYRQESLQDLLDQADAAMYQRKRSKKMLAI
ncbi:MAG TPA: GGDEF domain-containing protein [Terracidiphilus sp.]|jgi:diguanylate cyclase (GGDEF)-like protein|nr:GGDEF domain-containing protein [Terracidiphilus sp.]